MWRRESWIPWEFIDRLRKVGFWKGPNHCPCLEHMPRYASVAEFLGVWGPLMHWQVAHLGPQVGAFNRVGGSLGKAHEKDGDGQTLVG